MASKPKSTAVTQGSIPAAPRAPRTVKALTPVAQELLNTATLAAKEAKDKIKEAKALGKLIECVSKLSRWGIDKLVQAIDARAIEIRQDSERSSSGAIGKNPETSATE